MKIIMRAFVLLGLALGIAGAVQAAEPGGTLKFGRAADSLFLDPVLNDRNTDIWVLNNLYETLLLPTDDGKGLRPGLATEWQVAEDGLGVRLKLRDGVKFSDGSPLTAADVIWSLDRARDPNNGTWTDIVKSIDAVTAGASGEITIKLKRRDPTILSALATFNTAIMPKKLFEAQAGEKDADKAKTFAERPVGTGPFMLTDWTRNSRMILKRNPHYWGKDAAGAQLPYLDEIRMEVIPDDAARILKLQAGELDLIELVPFSRVAELKADPQLDMVLFPSTTAHNLIINNREKNAAGAPNPMHDKRVRQAMNHAIEKNALINVVMSGIGTPSGSLIPAATPYAIGNGVPPYPYDLAKAKQLMADAGFAGGFEFAIMTLAGNADDIQLATTVQQMWSQIGIKLKIDLVDIATRTSRYRAGDFDMRSVLWTNDINDPSQITLYYAYSPTTDSFHSGYKDAEVEKLFLASQEEVNPEKRAQLFAELQKRYIEAAPIVFLVETPLAVAKAKKVQGFVQLPLGNQVFRETHLAR